MSLAGVALEVVTRSFAYLGKPWLKKAMAYVPNVALLWRQIRTMNVTRAMEQAHAYRP